MYNSDMSGARTNRSLWDSVRASQPRPMPIQPTTSDPQANTEIEHKPLRPAGSAPASTQPGPLRPVTLSTTTIYIGVAVLVVLIVGVWAVASTVARWKHEKTENEALRATLTPHPESGSPQPQATPPAPLTDPGPDQTSSPQPPRGPATVDNPTPYYTSRGFLAADPRSAGLNYLQLANLDQRWAFKAVDYLTKNGLESFAVQSKVEKTASPANNPARYEVFVLAGLSKDEYAKKDTRERVEHLAEKLGKAWQKSEHGVSDFSKPLWVKFDGR